MASHSALTLLDLIRQARLAHSKEELRFQLVNDTQRLLPYRQAVLWSKKEGVVCLSGVVQVEANAPYSQWLERCISALGDRINEPASLTASDLPEELASQWEQWLPSYAYWVPLNLNANRGKLLMGGLLIARDLTWETQETKWLLEWVENWLTAWRLMRNSYPKSLWSGAKTSGDADNDYSHSLWRRAGIIVGVALLITACVVPVRLAILAPAELVPYRPALIRSPIDGVIGMFQVQPNDLVVEGQKLFHFDKAVLESKLAVAYQVLQTTQVEYRQLQQQALLDPRLKPQLALTLGKIEEKKFEVSHLSEQLNRTLVLSPQAGIVLFEDPSEWIGKPVNVGEVIMRIAKLQDKEIEAWIPLADAIPLPAGTKLVFHLNASPLAPVEAEVRYFAHEASRRPDGTYAYRLRARLLVPTDHRVGLKGTARILGDEVPLIYWVLRRPWATFRTFIGW